MPAVVIIGGQWGDEGKGRVVDFHARYCSLIARYSAGTNAGHTVINDLGKFALHLVPAGIFYGDKTCLIGNGVVIDPDKLLKEIAMLSERGVDTSNLLISDRAHVIMPWHQVIDSADEELRGSQAIGTTGTGTGPAFHDKVSRIGIRVADLINKDKFPERLEEVLNYKNKVIEKLYDRESLNFTSILEQYSALADRLRPYVTDTTSVVQESHERGEMILLEGAQGSLLDLDSGTYPYVTSSVPASVAAGAAIGIGLGPTAIERVVGVYKAYQTRVGYGAMPTELFDENAEKLREGGGGVAGTSEYGTTTGRARRCGWFDGVLAGYTSRLNGVTSVALTRLDSLTGFSSVKICVAYELNGKRVTALPAEVNEASNLVPIYEEMPGWSEDVSSVRNINDLPREAIQYVRRIEQLVGAPIDMISVGPERDQAIVTRDIFGGNL
ncbi:MAG: adenylosuccinate synthase [Chloroflexi bacterium]|nr:adenylosuccinate synthase [Chloroflexota bacterium]|tara:strand:- start:1138 stop:2457 length:1320 start_codon:yes stop_codon:yes gene_type:complete